MCFPPQKHLMALTYKLGAAPDEGEKLEVIQPPDTLTPSRLHSVGLLQFPHHFEIPENTIRTMFTCM